MTQRQLGKKKEDYDGYNKGQGSWERGVPTHNSSIH